MPLECLYLSLSVINYQVSTAAVRSATTGQFSNTIRTGLAQNLTEWTVNGRDYVYNVVGTVPPVAADDNTVYIYGSDQNTQVQRGQYISVSLDYPWHFRFFLIDNLSRWVVDQNDLRLRVNALFPSEVFFE